MDELPHVSEALYRSIADVQPDSFNAHLRTVLADRPLTPGVLTVKTARGIDPTADIDDLATSGAAVQLGYEGLRLTRAVIDAESWLDEDGVTEADLDLLAAEVLIARGIHTLADTGVVDQAIEIVRRFGRNRAYERGPEAVALEATLEEDAIKLAVNTGADLALSTIPPALAAYGERLAREIGTDPLPEPEVALEDVDEEVARLRQVAERPVVEEPSSSSSVDP